MLRYVSHCTTLCVAGATVRNTYSERPNPIMLVGLAARASAQTALISGSGSFAVPCRR